MIPIINFSNPLSVLVAVILFTLILLLARHTKKSYIPAVMLFVFLAIIAGHTIELATIDFEESVAISSIAISIIVDFMFILISFLSYLWIDDLEAKALKKRSIDNSLDWFWSKV